jgi:hypothetical protein
MALLSSTSPYGQPINVTSEDFTYTTGPYNANNTVFPLVLNTSLPWTSGRFVVLKTTGMGSTYVGCTVSWSGPSSRTILGVSREDVSYGGTSFDCLVVTIA